MRALIVAVLLPTVLRAEPQPAVLELMPYMDDLAACFDSATTPDEARVCLNTGSATCMETEANGYSTLGMMFCTMAETESWDRLLNREYQLSMTALRDMDSWESANFPEFAERADSLLAMQRAWITFRDEKCSLEYAMFGAGSMRQLAGSGCRLDMTSQQTIYLRFLRERM